MSIPVLPARDSVLVRLFKNDFVLAALAGIALSGITFALAYGLGWLTEPPNWFEVAGATINYGATVLSIRQRRFTYVLGFVASAAFAIAYYQYGLYASTILSAYLVGQLIYGYFRWGPDAKARPVHKFQWKWAWAYATATLLTYLGAFGLVTALGGNFAPLDAGILVATILAQFLLDNKVLAAWYVWMLVNVIGVILYTSSGAPFAAVQQFIFGLANIWGWYAWWTTMKAAGTEVIEPGDTVDQTVTEQDDPEWRKPDPEDLPNRHVTYTSADAHLARVEAQEYTGSSKVAATYHDPSPTTEIDQVKP